MEPSKTDFNITHYKQTLEQAPTEENGWKLTYEGPAEKKHPECIIRVYKKMMEGDAVITTRIEGTLRNLNSENFFKIVSDVDTMLKFESPMKQLRVVEQFSRNSDVIYAEFELPFPLANRDFVQKRLFLNNKDDAELVKKLGLYEMDHKYYVFIQQCVERGDYPPQKTPVRAETKMSYWLIEEDPNEKGVLKLKTVACQNMNGDIPLMVMNKLGATGAQKMFGMLMHNYSRIFGKE